MSLSIGVSRSAGSRASTRTVRLCPDKNPEKQRIFANPLDKRHILYYTFPENRIEIGGAATGRLRRAIGPNPCRETPAEPDTDNAGVGKRDSRMTENLFAARRFPCGKIFSEEVF